MAVAVKLWIADRASLRKAHQTNAAIFMDQRLFYDDSTEPCFFHMDGGRFSLAALRVGFFRFGLPFFARSTTIQGHFLHRSISFFGDESIELRFFPRAWKAVFPSMHFEFSFSFLMNDPF